MIQRHDILINNTIIKSGCVADLLINKKHRSPPSNLIKLTNACTSNKNFNILFHTSNQNSDAFYKNLFKYYQPFKLSSYIFPTSISGIIKKISFFRLKIFDFLFLPIYIILYVLIFNLCSLLKVKIVGAIPSQENLNNLAKKLKIPFARRDRAYLKWRFIDAPSKADIFSIRKNNIFKGYFVTKIVSFSGLRFLVVVDYLICNKLNYLDCLVIRLWLIKKSIKLNADFLFFMINKKCAISKLGCGFPLMEIPDFFLPHSTPIYFRLKNIKKNIKDNLVFMHFTLGDIDYF